MAIQYIVKEQKDPRNPEVQGKFYARSVTRGLVGTRDLAARIAYRSGHSVGAVQGVIEDIFEGMCHFMTLGYNVDCGNAGRFQLKINSAPEILKEDQNVGNIKKLYVHFQGRLSDYSGIAQFQKVINLYPKMDDAEPLP